MKASHRRLSALDLFGSFLLALGFLIIALLLCFSPWLFELIYKSMDYPQSYQNVANAIVHKLWDATAIKEIPRIGPLFSEKEIIHYNDIRTIIRRMIFGLSGISVMLIALQRSLHWLKALTGCFILFALIAIALGIWAGIDWEHMFNTLHWWLFQNDSWKLPKQCVTLKLFPYPVWQKFGSLVLIMTLGQMSLWILIARVTKHLKMKATT